MNIISKAFGNNRFDTTTLDHSELSRDTVFSMLSNQRRRWILYYLYHSDSNTVDFRSLVDSVAAWENDQPVEELSWKKRKRVYTALRQSHLPKLAESGFIEYDASRGVVELTDNAIEAKMYLEYIPGNDIAWSQYYFGLSIIGLVLVFLAWVSIFPFYGLPGLVLAGIIVAMFGTSALVHHYHFKKTRLGSQEPPPR